MQAFEISFPARPRRACRVRVGSGILDSCVEELAEHWSGCRLVLISDETVASLHGESLQERLLDRGLTVDLLRFPAGEASKSRQTRDRIEDALLGLGVRRDAVIVAVGGGVTGDLAGFVASTWHRGLPVVQLPTTLLAMVDSAIGGKTAINLPGGKNLVGTFHQPWGVYADVALLSTLAESPYRDGFSELIKSATIADARLFRWLESSHQALLQREEAALIHAVTACLRIKGRVVTRDERDRGRRAVLNFGHTVAHAVESASGYACGHGPAVALGMRVEGQLAVEETGFPESHRDRLEALLSACGLPDSLPPQASVDSVIEATHRDKKNRAGEVRYALPRRLGRMAPGGEVTVPVPDQRLRAVLRGRFAGRFGESGTN